MASDPTAVAFFRDRREEVLARIEAAARRAGREPSSVELVAVCKTVEPPRIRAAVEAGFTILGENRVQEAAAKIPGVGAASWHLIGPLQSNKARRAVELFDVVETVDSVELARRLDRLVSESARDALDVFLQVNVDGDPAKSGFFPEAVAPALPDLSALPHLRLRGLMTVGRLVAAPELARPTFSALRELSGRLRLAAPMEVLGSGLSMGMTDDFEIAVEEGATLVRIGRAIFGERPKR